MTKRDVGSLAFKLAGICVLVEAVFWLFEMCLWGVTGTRNLEIDRKLFFIVAVVPGVLLCAGGYALVRFSAVFASRMFSDPEVDVTFAVTASDLQAVALTVLGVYLIASALPGFVRIGFTLAIEAANWNLGSAVTVFFGNMTPVLVDRGLQIAIGVFLLIGRRGFDDLSGNIKRMWKALRGPVEEPSEE